MEPSLASSGGGAPRSRLSGPSPRPQPSACREAGTGRERRSQPVLGEPERAPGLRSPVASSDAEWRRLVEAWPLDDLSLAEAGVVVLHVLQSFPGRLGSVARSMIDTLVGSGKFRAPSSELLPLPVAPRCPEFGRIVKALGGGALVSDVRKDFKRSLRIAGHHAWVTLATVALNTMSLGYSAAHSFKPAKFADVNEVQQRALLLIERDV